MRALWNGKGLGLNALGASKPVHVEEPDAKPPAALKDQVSPSYSAASPISSTRLANSTTVLSQPLPAGDAFDAMELPFSPGRQNKRLQSSANDSTFTGSQDGTTDRTSAISSAEPSPAFSSLFGNSPRKARPGSHKSSISSQITAPGDEMLMEILSSQAMLESREFEVLSWNDLESLKKDHQFVMSRITALQYKLNLEIKMRDATLLMERPELGSSFDSRMAPQAPKMNALNMSKSESYANKLEAASSSIASVTADLTRLQQQEFEVRTKLLRHMAGVLGYVLSKREGAQSAVDTTPSPSRRNSTRPIYRFEGPHLFAGSRDATRPVPTTPQSLSRSVPSSATGHGGQSVEATLNAELQQRLDNLQAEHEDIISKYQDSQQESHDLRRQLDDAQEEASRIRHDHEQLSSDHSELYQQHASASSEVQALRGQLEDVHQQRTDIDSQLQATEANLRALEQSTKGEAGALSTGLAQTEESLRMTEEEKRRMQQIVSELEGQLSSERNLATERSQQTNKLRASINDLAKKFELPPVPTARNQAGSDEHATLLSWIDTQLASGKSRAADMTIIQSRITDLQQQLTTKDSELQRAQQAIDTANTSSSTLQRDFDQQRQLLDSHESSVALIPKLRADITALEAKVTSVASERDVARGHLADATRYQEEQKISAAKLDSALQELWKMLPVQRDVKPGEADDLAAWKKAFTLPAPVSRLPILRSNTSAPSAAKYSFDAFCERIRSLVSDDKQLVDRLMKHEGSVKASSSSLQSLEQASKQKDDALKQKEEALAAAQKEVKDLQAYVESSAVTQADMLERLNEAQQQAENIRSEKRRLEASTGSTAAANPSRIAELEAALGDAERNSAQLLASEHGRTAQLENQVQAANSELQDLREALEDAREELEDSREREQKGRMQLMDEVSKLGREVSSLRSQLKQEQRKAAKLGDSVGSSVAR